VCGTEVELLAWAGSNSVAVERCRHCVRDEFIGGETETRPAAPDVAGTATETARDRDEDDLNSSKEFAEGAIENILATRYERNRVARRACLDHYGAVCRACGLKMGGMYGPLGEGYIHVHHKVPLSTIGREYRLDPIKDLVPVCPNCHAMLHQTTIPLEVEALAEIVRERARAAELGVAAGGAAPRG
jgi:5-methylcytosine-specific restriction enzyme A